MPRIFDHPDFSLPPAPREPVAAGERAEFCIGRFNLRVATAASTDMAMATSPSDQPARGWSSRMGATSIGARDLGLALAAALLAGLLPAMSGAGLIGPWATERPNTPTLSGVAPIPRPQPMRFFALGDLPYFPGEDAQLRSLLEAAGRGGAPFAVHVGDIKGGSTPCTDGAIAEIATIFRAAPVPVAYTPGDNEWTDCRRSRAGGHDPLERLTALRRLLFGDNAVLRRDRLQVVVPDPALPENAWFIHRDVLFALVHVVGSENNRRPREPAAMVDFRARTTAASALLRGALPAGELFGVRAVVVVFHANPLFERSPPLPAFAPLLADLEWVLHNFDGPVLALHGDTHRLRFDQPWQRRGADDPTARLWRIEVPGAPLAGGVWVTVDPQAAGGRAFQIEPIYPSGTITPGNDISLEPAR